MLVELDAAKTNACGSEITTIAELTHPLLSVTLPVYVFAVTFTKTEPV